MAVASRYRRHLSIHSLMTRQPSMRPADGIQLKLCICLDISIRIRIFGQEQHASLTHMRCMR